MPRSIALFAVVVLGGTASADVVRPKPTHRIVTVPGGDKRLASLVTNRSSQILACADGALLKARVRATFDRGQRARQITVDADGDHPFERCVANALRGREARGGGPNGPVEITFAIDVQPVVAPPPPAPSSPVLPPPAPAPVTKPAPTPIQPARTPSNPAPTRPAPTTTTASATDFTSCRADDDCTLYFRLLACTPGDPLAVNKRGLDAARAAYPVKNLACGMGGPQYEQLRASNEGRYSATCVKNRCELRDSGPKPTTVIAPATAPPKGSSNNK